MELEQRGSLANPDMERTEVKKKRLSEEECEKCCVLCARREFHGGRRGGGGGGGGNGMGATHARTHAPFDLIPIACRQLSDCPGRAAVCAGQFGSLIYHAPDVLA
jgi:hypothetical protein